MTKRKTMTPETRPSTAEKNQKRRYVRLELFSPVQFTAIIIDEEKRVRLHPDKRAGILLNLSGGGALVSSTDTATSGEMVLMRFEVKDFEALTNVLGLVKRVEDSGDGERLIGVEFLSPSHLDDPRIAAALSRLTDHPKEFAEGLSRLISRYVFQRQIESGAE